MKLTAVWHVPDPVQPGPRVIPLHHSNEKKSCSPACGPAQVDFLSRSNPNQRHFEFPVCWRSARPARILREGQAQSLHESAITCRGSAGPVQHLAGRLTRSTATERKNHAAQRGPAQVDFLGSKLERSKLRHFEFPMLARPEQTRDRHNRHSRVHLLRPGKLDPAPRPISLNPEDPSHL
jgi:hypothetical protein